MKLHKTISNYKIHPKTNHANLFKPSKTPFSVLPMKLLLCLAYVIMKKMNVYKINEGASR